MRLVFLSLSIITVLLSGQTFTQDHSKKIIFPDIPGYHTLICDFHMHSVYSDGLVWPTVRIDEAVEEGIHAISLSEHIEYRPHANDINAGHNRAYELTLPYAEKKGVILVRGAEITRSMPPGHFNAIFISDANMLDTSDWRDAIRIANEQGGFVVWNHPGWRQPDEIPVWYSEHSWLLEQGLIQGIEIVNERSYYPLAHQWALDSGLVIIGNSDIHDPVDKFYNKCEGEHRAVTLVFAKEKTSEGIREAILAGRTAVYYKDMLMGDEHLMRDLFKASVTYKSTIVTMGGKQEPESHYKNSSSFTFKMKRNAENSHDSEIIFIEPGLNGLKGKDGLKKENWIIGNIFVAPDKPLEINL